MINWIYNNRQEFCKWAFGLIILVFSITACKGLNNYFGLKDDNIVEQAAEMFIEEEIGISVDLTPVD